MYRGKYAKYLSNWGNNEECEEYEDKIDSWLSQFNECDQNIMLRLLENFKMYRGHLLDLKIKESFDMFKMKYPGWEMNSIFIEAKKDEEDVGNSDIFFSAFWRVTGVRKWSKRFMTKEVVADRSISRIVIVDDYSGSGSTTISFLNKIINDFPEIKSKNITLLFLAISKSAEIALSNYNITAKLNLDILSINSQGKAFAEDEIFSAEELKIVLPKYLEISNNYKLNFPKGFRDVEALIAFDYGTPNNTLGICWERPRDNTFHGFWPRREIEIPTPESMFRAKKNRRAQANRSIFKNSTEDLNDYFFMGCCIASKKKFDLDKIIKQFGLTRQQFDTKLAYCLDNNYMQLVDGAFVATEKFLSNVKPGYKAFFKSILDGEFGENFTRQQLEVNYKHYICKHFE